MVGKQESASYVLAITVEYGILLNIHTGAFHGYVSYGGVLATAGGTASSVSVTYFHTIQNSYDASVFATTLGASWGPPIGLQQSFNGVYSSGNIGVNYTIGVGGGVNVFFPAANLNVAGSVSNTTLLPLNEIAKKEKVYNAAIFNLTQISNTNTSKIGTLQGKNIEINKKISTLLTAKISNDTDKKILDSLIKQKAANNIEINKLKTQNMNIESLKNQLNAARPKTEYH